MPSFGIADLLEENTPIYHTVLFNTTHAGRVIDLVGAFLATPFKSDALQEFKMRNVITLSLFQTYFSQVIMDRTDLLNPAILECGLDSLKLVIGLSFILSEANNLKLANLIERLNSRTPAGLFENVLIKIAEHCDRLTIKYYPRSRRLELNATIFLEGPSSALAPSLASLELVVYGDYENPTMAEGRPYIDLGDLKFPKFLTKEISGTIESTNATDDFFVVKKSPSGRSFLSKIFGRRVIDSSESQVVAGQADNEPETVTVVSGGDNFSDFPNFPAFNDALLKIASTEVPTDLLSQIEFSHTDEIIQLAKNQLSQSETLRDSKMKEWADGVLAALTADRLKAKRLAGELRQANLARDVDTKNQITALSGELIDVKKKLETEMKKSLVQADQHNRQAKTSASDKNLDRHTREEYAALRSDHDTLVGQLEEFKKINRRLMERLNEYRAPADSTSSDSDVKKKLSAAMRLLSVSRKETEGMKVFVEKLRSNEIALRKRIEELEKK